MRLSVVIPAFNEEKLLPSTLRAVHQALGAAAARGWESEVIVCDNNSTDATPRVAAAHGATVVFEPINMIARARDAGAAAATGDWIVFVDADSQPSRGLVDATLDAIATGSVVAGGTTVRLDGGGRMVRFLAGGWNLVSRVARRFAGSYIFVRADAFRAVGGFGTEHYAGEELNLARKIHALARREGKRVVILSRTPLLTSARKSHLYTPAELGRFLLRAVFRPKATLASREACAPWYDGRR